MTEQELKEIRERVAGKYACDANLARNLLDEIERLKGRPHVCGHPDSCCDAMCMNFASEQERNRGLKQEIERLKKEASEGYKQGLEQGLFDKRMDEVQLKRTVRELRKSLTNIRRHQEIVMGAEEEERWAFSTTWKMANEALERTKEYE